MRRVCQCRNPASGGGETVSDPVLFCPPRKASIRKLDPDDVFPWNVGLYEGEYDPWGSDYVESVGAETHAEAIALADAWVNYKEELFKRLRIKGLENA